MSGLERITEEFKDLTANPISNCGVTVGLVNNDYTKWQATLIGPKDTSYVGGLFKLNINFPSDYPNKAPEVCFITPIYHMNVNPRAPRSAGEGVESLGHVCISTLNWWKPEYRIREVLTNIFALFYMANPESPYGLDRAEEFLENRAVYEEKAKHFTKKYANPMANITIEPNKDWDFDI